MRMGETAARLHVLALRFNGCMLRCGAQVKAVERTTNHDVKAIEYVLKSKFAADPELSKVWVWVCMCQHTLAPTLTHQRG
jgi:hypothetical protein